VARSQRNNRKTRKQTTPKRVRIRPNYSATVAFSWQEDKDGTKKQIKPNYCARCSNMMLFSKFDNIFT